MLIDLLNLHVINFINYLKIIINQSSNTVIAYKKDLILLKIFLTKEKTNSGSYIKKNNHSQEIQEFLKSLYEKKYHPNSIYRIRCSLASFFKYLINQKIISSSPLDNLYSLKQKKTLPIFLNETAIKNISNSLNNQIDNSPTKYLSTRDQIIWELLYGLGLRISEVTNLTLEKINLNQKTITILGKGNTINLLPLTNKLQILITNYIKTRNIFLENKQKSHNFFLVNNHGRPITTRGVRYAFMSCLKKNKIDGRIYPHALRHSIATHLLENGADIKRVQQLLRHKSIETTQIYTHLSKNSLKKSYLKYHPLAKTDYSKKHLI